MPYRKAARVLPEPVGAWISVWPPRAIAGQPSACAGVGSANACSNQARVSALKTASGSTRPAYRSRSAQRLGDLEQLVPAEIAGDGDDKLRGQRPDVWGRPGVDVDLSRDPVEGAAVQLHRLRMRRQAGRRTERIVPPTAAAPPRRDEELVEPAPVGERDDVARGRVVGIRRSRLAGHGDLAQAVA